MDQLSFLRNLDFWQLLFTGAAIVAAYLVGKKQNQISLAMHRVNDTVELYATAAWLPVQGPNGPVDSKPVVFLQNIGTRLVYLDRYVFNGRTYDKHAQILPSTYSQAKDAYYRIDLPTNGDSHVSLVIDYHDLEGRKWRSEVFCEIVNGSWNIETRARCSLDV